MQNTLEQEEFGAYNVISIIRDSSTGKIFAFLENKEGRYMFRSYKKSELKVVAEFMSTFQKYDIIVCRACMVQRVVKLV